MSVVHRRLRTLIVCLSLAGVALASVAQAAPHLTESEFLAPLTDDHPAVVALMDGLAEAEGQKATSRLLNPEIGFDREAPGDAASQSVMWLRWQPPLDGRRGLQSRAAELGLSAATAEFAWTRLQLELSLRGLYAEWVRAQELHDLLADHMDTMSRLSDRATTRASAGEESGLAARRLALATAEVRAELASADVALEQALARVRVFHPDLDPQTRPLRPDLPPAPSPGNITTRPDLEAKRLDMEQAELNQRLSGRYWGFPELLAGWTRIEGGGQSVDGPVFGVSWDLPLFDRDQGERARASRSLSVAEARLQLAQTEAESDLQAAREVYGHLRAASIEVNAAVADAPALVASATAAFQMNESTLTDLLETLRSVLSSQVAAVRLNFEALAAHRALEASMGSLSTSGGIE